MTKYDGEFIFITKFTRYFDVIETYDTGSCPQGQLLSGSCTPSILDSQKRAFFTTLLPLYNKIFCNNHKLKNNNNAEVHGEIFLLLNFVHIIVPINNFQCEMKFTSQKGESNRLKYSLFNF